MEKLVSPVKPGRRQQIQMIVRKLKRNLQGKMLGAVLVE